MSQFRKRARRDQRSIQPSPMVLMERDVQIIQAVSSYRLLRQDQLARLFFSSPSATQRVLQRLFQHGYLARRFLAITSGRSPTLYALDRRGWEFLKNQKGHGFRPRYVPTDVKTAFLAHLLAVNDFRIAVTLAAEQTDCRFIRWLDQSDLRADYDRVLIEGKSGRPESMPLIPDSYFTLKTRHGHANCFLEMDMGTMTISRFQAKVHAYICYYRSGGFERRFGAKTMRVLTVTSSTQRQANLIQATEAVGGKRPFWFARLSDLTPETALTQPVWSVATEAAKASLIEPMWS